MREREGEKAVVGIGAYVWTFVQGACVRISNRFGLDFLEFLVFFHLSCHTTTLDSGPDLFVVIAPLASRGGGMKMMRK